MANGWIWDRDDWRQEGYLGVLERKLPVEKARWSACQRFRDRVTWDLEHCHRYVVDREDERRHRPEPPGELLDIPDLLARLSEVERDIVKMRHWEDMEFHEIGKRVGRHGKTAWRWYMAAIAKMKD